MRIMEANPDTLLHVLTNTRVGTRFSKVGFASLCFFEFVHGMGAYTLNNAVSLSGECFGLSDYQMRILFVVHFANSYISPILAALFADLKVGKYRAIFFSAAMRTFAAMILLIIAVIFSVSDKATISPTLKSALFGVYVFGLMFLFVSIEFFSSLLMPFGIQQVNQESRTAITSAVRWLMWSYDAGVVVSTLVMGHFRNLYREYHLLIETVSSFIFSCLMISVFILGKSQYNRCTTTEGRASFATIFNLIKKRFCCRLRYQSLDEPMTFGPDNSGQHMVHQRIKMERLILRKMFLMMGFFACVGVAEVVYFKMFFIKAIDWPRNDFDRHTFTSGYLALVVYIPTIVLIPICEFVTRRKRAENSPLVGDQKIIQFKTMGVGLVMTALAVLGGALFCRFKEYHPDITTRSFWQIPSFILLGMMTLLTYIKALEFCYTESFKGLECSTTSLLSSLWMLLYSILTWAEVEWIQDSYHMEILFYSLTGAMVITILFIFIPVSVWYNKVKAEIAEAKDDFSNTGYDTLTGSTLLTGRFLTINEATRERVQKDLADDDSDDNGDTMAKRSACLSGLDGSERDGQ